MKRLISIIICISAVFALFSYNSGMRLGLDWYILDENPHYTTVVGSSTFNNALAYNKDKPYEFTRIYGTMYGQSVVIYGYPVGGDYLVLKAHPMRNTFVSDYYIEFIADINSTMGYIYDGENYTIYYFSSLRRRSSFVDNFEVINTLVTVYNEARVSLDDIDNIGDFFEFIYTNIRETYRLIVSAVLIFSSGGTYI